MPPEGQEGLSDAEIDALIEAALKDLLGGGAGEETPTFTVPIPSPFGRGTMNVPWSLLYPALFSPVGYTYRAETPQAWMSPDRLLAGGYRLLDTGGLAPSRIPTFDSSQLALRNLIMAGLGTGAAGGGGALSYDPFSQALQAAQLQEAIREYNISAGLDRAAFLQSALATPANVFSSFFLSRGQVPPYNAQLANILNLPAAGQPFFGTLPALGQTPAIPAIPSPQAPQAIPYAQGGTYMAAEPAVAVGLWSGTPLFTFNEQAPGKVEKVKITPQKVPSFQGGGTAYTIGAPGVSSGAAWPSTYSATSGEAPAWLPAPLADVFARGFPRFPYLESLGRGQSVGYPQLSQALQGFPLPSPQSLNRLTPSELAALADMYNTVFGVPAADVGWASMLPFAGLRSGMPAMRLIT